jgi:hypothetical protein
MLHTARAVRVDVVRRNLLEKARARTCEGLCEREGWTGVRSVSIAFFIPGRGIVLDGREELVQIVAAHSRSCAVPLD